MPTVTVYEYVPVDDELEVTGDMGIDDSGAHAPSSWIEPTRNAWSGRQCKKVKFISNKANQYVEQV